MKQPQTDAEWQEAVDLAHGALSLDAAQKYGLVDGGPTINVERCSLILQLGRMRGIVPGPEAIDRFLADVERIPVRRKKGA